MRLALCTLLVLVGAGALLAASAGASERSSCPNGYTAYAIPDTEAELLSFPRIAAGLAADPAPYTAVELIELAAIIDANGDEIFCLKAVSNLRGESTKHWAFFYLARDNDAAAS
jgi:hypothetical protein